MFEIDVSYLSFRDLDLMQLPLSFYRVMCPLLERCTATEANLHVLLKAEVSESISAASD
jgi:hypothetical protein